MAKFVTEDGKGGISGDAFMQKYGYEHKSYADMWIEKHPPKKHHTDIEKLKVPGGRTNGHRINNINDYDLLTHIQETLSLTGRCIIEMITNEDHVCLKMNDTILRRIHQFADKNMDESFILSNPKIKMHVKIDEDKYEERWETDDEWHDRLCHMYMHQYHPAKLQMIKCEECMQKWLNSDKW